MITPCRIMIKALEPVTEFAVKIYCNDTQFPFMIADHGVHFDIYRNVDMYFYSIDTAFECPTDQSNQLALVWTKKPDIDMEIDDIELEMLTFLRDESTGPAGMSKFVDVLGLDIGYVREKLHMLRREGLVKNMGRSGHTITRKGKDYLESRSL